MPTILIIDDEPVICQTLSHAFGTRLWDVHTAQTAADGLKLADEAAPDVILLDMRLPDRNGDEVLKILKDRACTASVVVMTGWGTIGDAVSAIKLGAEQYLTKPVDLVELGVLVDGIIEKRRLRIENLYYRQRLDHPVVGNSREIQKLHHMIDLMAENPDTTVLLLGESGTGKELVSREIHRRSPRKDRPFMDLNCDALSETLLESELFGHERGAFTDAREMKRGLLEVADGGTVFLDEVGDMPQAMQPKLLRVLETRKFKRVGGTRDIQVNVRIIAATNRDLAKAAADGRFREDLYYRLKVFPVVMPALRERPEDIPVLAGCFVDQFNRALKKSSRGFSPDALDLMSRYAWPGNVRELKNVVERAVVLSGNEPISPQVLPREMQENRDPQPTTDSASPVLRLKALVDVEREHIRAMLAAHQGNRSTTAKALGISRSTLLEKMKKYGIT